MGSMYESDERESSYSVSTLFKKCAIWFLSSRLQRVHGWGGKWLVEKRSLVAYVLGLLTKGTSDLIFKL